MAYNYVDRASSILGLKGEWEAGDEAAKKRAANRAKAIYDDLTRNGYGDVADRLRASDYGTAKTYVNRLKTSGMTPVRDYLVAGLGKYGISADEANKNITWNPDTGEVFLGAVNVGKGDAMADGKNYVEDTGRLDDALANYTRLNGISAPASTQTGELRQKGTGALDAWGEETGRLTDRMYGSWDRGDELWDDVSGLAKTPYNKTNEYKDIMSYYTGLGENAGYGAIAGAAANNGGNVDSYAAAQGARQMKSFTDAGNEAARQWYAQRFNNLYNTAMGYGQDWRQNAAEVNDVLRNYGDIAGKYFGEEQQAFDNDQTAQNNEAAREYTKAQTEDIYGRLGMDEAASEADITGRTPLTLDPEYQRLFNRDGSLKQEFWNTDFQRLMNEARAQGNENLAQIYNMARHYKANNVAGYENWRSTLEPVSYRGGQTEAGRQADLAQALGLKELDTDRDIAQISADAALGQSANELAGVKYQAETALGQSANELAGVKYQTDAEERINSANNDFKKLLLDLYKQEPYVQSSDIRALFSREEDPVTGEYVYKATSAGKKSGLNSEGMPALEALAQYADDNGGFLSPDEIREFLSRRTDTAVEGPSYLTEDQAKRIYMALGISESNTAAGGLSDLTEDQKKRIYKLLGME